jgi:hypothetical protein
MEASTKNGHLRYHLRPKSRSVQAGDVQKNGPLIPDGDSDSGSEFDEDYKTEAGTSDGDDSDSDDASEENTNTHRTRQSPVMEEYFLKPNIADLFLTV